MGLPFADARSTSCLPVRRDVLPRRPAAFAEVRRVLRPGGRSCSACGTQLAENELPRRGGGVAELFPDDPPSFLERTPHGYHDAVRIAPTCRRRLHRPPTIDTVVLRSRADSAHAAAIGYCQGTPMYNEIVARDPEVVPIAIERATAALTTRFGATDLDAAIRALVVAVSAS